LLRAWPVRRFTTSRRLREYVESLGFDIVANFGDQFSDLTGGFADKTFKLPNPNYFLP
jgi:putative acid phosphatase of HAD superfamily subfamily IIIB